MDISNLDIIEFASGNYADIYITDDTKYAIKMPNYKDENQKIFDPMVGVDGSCDYGLLIEAFFSALKNDRVVNAKICLYEREFALISKMNGTSLDIYSLHGSHLRKQLTWFMYQIISALNNIHRHHLVHGDVALRNIIFNVDHYATYVDDIIINNNDKRLDRIQFIDFAVTTFENLTDINKDYDGLLSSLAGLIGGSYMFDNPGTKNFDLVSDKIKYFTGVLDKIKKRIPLSDILLDPLFDELNERYADVIESAKINHVQFDVIMPGIYLYDMLSYIDDISDNIIGSYQSYFSLIAKEIFENFISVNGMPQISKIRLYGATAIFITLKILDIELLGDDNAVIGFIKFISRDDYTLDEIRKAELEILKLIDFSRIFNNVICRAFNHCE